MLDRSKKRPKDSNELAHQVFLESIGEAPVLKLAINVPVKNPNAVALGRLGGLKGGQARAASLSPKKRIAIAKKAAAARWSKKP